MNSHTQEGESRFVRTLRLRSRGSIGTVKTKKPRVPALKPFLPSLTMCVQQGVNSNIDLM